MDVPACFKHTPLDLTRSSLRLVDLLPRQEDGRIQCTVRHELQHPDLRYTAVSYEWGNPHPEVFTIHINGRPFKIRHNLFSFLQSLLTMYPGGYKDLWIDALCIDQQSHGERNHQVQRMSQIYGAAYPTFVWLGPAADESDQLFESIASAGLEHGWSAGMTSGEEVASLTEEQWQEYRDRVLLDKFHLWAACQRLSSRTYWTRTWVLQEILLAQKLILICGTKTCPWSAWTMIMTISRGARSTATRGWVPRLWDSSAKFICNYWLSYIRGVPDTGLISLVLRFQQSQCSVKHDKVYGVLGLASDASRFEIDYRCSMEDLYYQLLDWRRPTDAFNDALELCRLFDVRPPFAVLVRLLHPGSTLRDVTALCEYFQYALPHVQDRLSLVYPDKVPDQTSFASIALTTATAQSVGDIDMLSGLLTGVSIKWAASRPSVLEDLKDSSPKGVAAFAAKFPWRITQRCSCSMCCPDTIAGARSFARFNMLTSLRDDDMVRQLEETDAVIFYRRDKSSNETKYTYLATGLKNNRAYGSSLLLIYDPVDALQCEDDTRDTDSSSRAIRATLAQSLNLVIHQKLPTHHRYSGESLREVKLTARRVRRISARSRRQA
ncbi:hypothetical protein PV11_01870 [Exophiala sideris]|uniref:Heterokaryon incompatibility domain-containing protein n=1 Tax=Exophiala sideris TaxID=1016849 RepID=A0A0D1YUH0_9EURO|nr:hypothetical protein PV11_01870 [Exophiala sideris]